LPTVFYNFLFQFASQTGEGGVANFQDTSSGTRRPSIAENEQRGSKGSEWDGAASLCRFCPPLNNGGCRARRTGTPPAEIPPLSLLRPQCWRCRSA
jgi:hypothetical protein